MEVLVEYLKSIQLPSVNTHCVSAHIWNPSPKQLQVLVSETAGVYIY